MKYKKCPGCSNSFIHRNKYCSKNCLEKNRKHSEQTKKKISESRKKYLRDNKDKHPWKRKNKFISAPCENVKKYLDDNNIKYISEWSPLEDRFYSIDIAFPDKKIGIEINGNQHYNKNGTLKEYYQKRHDDIVKAGWVLYEFHYTEGFYPERIMKHIELGEQPDYSEYFELIEQRKKKNKPYPKGVKQRMIANEKAKPYIEKIKNSDIDFSKLGWAKEVSKILDISNQKVSKWMQRHMPDFYDERCWKRKSPKKK